MERKRSDDYALGGRCSEEASVFHRALGDSIVSNSDNGSGLQTS